MKLKKIIFAFTLLYVTGEGFCRASDTVNAKSVLEDPKSILSEVDKFLGNVSFEDAFHIGDKVEIQFHQDDIIWPLYGVSKAEINSCTQSECIYKYLDSELEEVSITRSMWETNSGNLLRQGLIAESLPPYTEFVNNYRVTKVLINSKKLEKYEIDKKKYDAIRVDWTTFYESKDGYSYQDSEYVVLLKNVPGIAQVFKSSGNPGSVVTAFSRK